MKYVYIRDWRGREREEGGKRKGGGLVSLELKKEGVESEKGREMEA